MAALAGSPELEAQGRPCMPTHPTEMMLPE